MFDIVVDDVAKNRAYLNPSSNAPLSNVNVFGVGAVYSVTPAVTLNGAFYYAVNKGMSENKSRMFAFGAEYALSKRTIVYSQVGVAHNQGAFQATWEYVTLSETRGMCL